jgi:hypothetical protein
MKCYRNHRRERKITEHNVVLSGTRRKKERTQMVTTTDSIDTKWKGGESKTL